MSYKFTTGSVRRGDIYFEDDDLGSATYIDFGMDTITLRPSGSEMLYVDSDQVGINTTSPSKTLTVAGTISASSTLEVAGATTVVGALNVTGTVYVTENIEHAGDSDTYVKFQTDTINFVAGGNSFFKYDDSAATPAIKLNNTNADINVQIMADDGEVIIHTDAGTNKVGINTDSPTYALDVAGDAGFNEYLYHNDDTDTFIRLQADKMTFETGGENMIYLIEGGGGVQADKVTINDSSNDIDFQVKGDTQPNLLRTDAANDRVGIGTVAPSASLNISSSQGSLFQVDSESGSVGVILYVSGGATGRVGIGTETPTHALTVAGGISGSSTLQVAGATTVVGALNVTGAVTLADDLTTTSDTVTISSANAADPLVIIKKHHR